MSQVQVLPKAPKCELAKVIGLISDTHIPVRSKEIPPQVFKIFENADYIVHAGDLVELSVIDELEQIAPVLAVCGNMDAGKAREKLPKTDSFKFSGWRIGVTHNPGTIFGFGKMRQIAKKNSFDVLVYGHTHASNTRWDDDVLFINPGSPTNPMPPFVVKPSVALLKVTKERITPEIVQL